MERAHIIQKLYRPEIEAEISKFESVIFGEEV